MAHGSEVTTYRRICSSDGFATVVVCSAIFTDTFMYDLIIPFMPRMLEDRLNIPSDRTQLWTSILLGAFGVTYLCATLIVGALTDWVRSKRGLFLLGMLTMTASTLFFFLGTHIAITVVARALQGLSAALVWVSGLAFLTSHVEAKNLGWVMGNISVAQGAGELLGPIVGGIMYEHAGHFAVLGLVCAVLGVDVVLRVILVDKSPDQSTSPNEVEEASPLLPGSLDEPQSTQQSPQQWKEPTAKKPEQAASIELLGYRLSRDFCASCYAVSISGIILFALEATLSTFVSHHFGWTTSASGGVLFAFVCPTVFSPAIASFTMKYGPRWISVVVFVVGGAALIGLGFLTGEAKVTRAFYVVTVTVMGTCISAIWTIYNVAFSVAAKRNEERAKREGTGSAGTGKSFGSLQTGWAVGLCVGPFVADVLLENFHWLGLCAFLAALSLLSGLIMSMTWREWELPEDDQCE